MTKLNKPQAFLDKHGFYKSDLTLGDLKHHFEAIERDLLGIDVNYKNEEGTKIEASKAMSLCNSFLNDIKKGDGELILYDRAMFMAYVAYYWSRSKASRRKLTDLISEHCRDFLANLDINADILSKVSMVSSTEHYAQQTKALFELKEYKDFIAPLRDEFTDSYVVLAPMFDFLSIKSSPLTLESAPTIASCLVMRIAYFMARAEVSPFVFRNMLPLLDSQANSMFYAHDRHIGSRQKYFYNIKKLFTFLASLKHSRYSEEIIPFAGLSAQACMYIAIACFTGVMLPKDPHAARLWLRMSALQGHPLAYYYDILINNSMEYNQSGTNSNFIDEIIFAYNLSSNFDYAKVNFEPALKLDDGTQCNVSEYLLYNSLVALAKRCHLVYITEKTASDSLNIYDYGIFVIEGFKKMVLERKRRFAAPLFIICSLTYEDIPILDQGFILALLHATEAADEDVEGMSVYDKILSIVHRSLQLGVLDNDVFCSRVIVDQDEALRLKFSKAYQDAIYIKALEVLVKNYDAGAVNTLLRICSQRPEIEKSCQQTVDFIHEHIHKDMQSPIVDLFNFGEKKDLDFGPQHIYLLSQMQNMYYALSERVSSSEIASTLLRFGADSMDTRCMHELQQMKKDGRYKPVAYVSVIDSISNDAEDNALCAFFMANVYREGNLLPRNIVYAVKYYHKAFMLGFDEALECLKQLNSSMVDDYYAETCHNYMHADAMTFKWRLKEEVFEHDLKLFGAYIKDLFKAIYKKTGPFERYLHSVYSHDTDNILSHAVGFLQNRGVFNSRDLKYLSSLEEKCPLSFIPMDYTLCQNLFCFNDLSSFEIESFLNSNASYNLQESEAQLYLAYMSSYFVLGFSSMFLDYKMEDNGPAPEILKSNLEILHMIAAHKEEYNLNFSPFYYLMLYRLSMRSHVISPDSEFANRFLQLAANRQSNLSILYQDQDLSVFNMKLNPKDFNVDTDNALPGGGNEVYISRIEQ